MADHSVGTSYMKAKLVMQSLMFCFAVDLFCLFFDVATSCCVSEYSLNASRRDRNVPSGSPLRENSGSIQFVDTKFTIAAGTKVCLLRFRIEAGADSGEVKWVNFHPLPLFLSPLLSFFLIPQILIGSITLLQKFTPHFKILDPRLRRSRSSIFL